MLNTPTITYEPAARRPIADLLRRTADFAVGLAVNRGIHPDVVSYASIAAAASAALCFWQAASRPSLLLAATAFCVLRLWLNMLDGMVALASGKASRRGEVVNEVPDRVCDVLIFAGVAHGGWCHPTGAYWAAILSLFVAYVGTLAQAVGTPRQYGGVMAKPWRMAVLGLGACITFGLLWGGADPRFAGLTVIDWAHLVIVAGCVQTIAVRLARILRTLETEPQTGDSRHDPC